MLWKISGVDRRDLHFRVFLPMTNLLVEAFSTAIFHRDDLRPLDRTDDIRHDRCAGEHGLADFRRTIPTDLR